MADNYYVATCEINDCDHAAVRLDADRTLLCGTHSLDHHWSTAHAGLNR